MVAGRPLPGFDNSAMDGYAARSADLPATLPVAGAIAAGQLDPPALPAGAALRILTGAPMPPGADTVVIQEDAARDGDRVRLPASPVGDNVRRGRRGHRGRRDRAHRRHPADRLGHRPVRRARHHGAAGGARAARRADRDRRRAGRRGDPAAARPAGRLVGPRAGRAGPRGRRHRRSARHRARRPGVARRPARRRGRPRRGDHDRRGVGRRPRLRPRRARRRRDLARAVQGRDEAGQAVLVRHAPRRARRRRCSACPATRCRRWSRSSCSSGRRCSRCRARRVVSRPERHRCGSPAATARTRAAPTTCAPAWCATASG